MRKAGSTARIEIDQQQSALNSSTERSTTLIDAYTLYTQIRGAITWTYVIGDGIRKTNASHQKTVLDNLLGTQVRDDLTSTSLRSAVFIGLAIELSRVGSHAAEKAGFSIRVGLYVTNNPQRRSL